MKSALLRPQTSLSNGDVYGTIFEKASALLHSLVLNPPFVDGNKRTSFVSTTIFLEINGYELETSTEAGLQFILAIEKRSET